MSATDFSLLLSFPSAVLSSFSVSKWWCPVTPVSNPLKFNSRFPAAERDYDWLNVGHVAGRMQ